MNESCPTPTGHFIGPDGRRRPRSCRRLRCGYCGPRLALSTVRAIELAKPHSSAVVTLPRDSTPVSDRALLRAFASVLGAVANDLRADGLTFQYAYTVELDSRLKPNLHALHLGDRISSSRFRSALSRAGGQGDTQPIRNLKVLSRYCLKLALSGIDDPNVDAATAMDIHLRINGGKILHSSRHFWRDADGSPLSGVRAARLAARSKPTGPAPTPEQLAAWHANWKLPPIGDANGRSVDAVRRLSTPAEGPGFGVAGSELQGRLGERIHLGLTNV